MCALGQKRTWRLVAPIARMTSAASLPPRPVIHCLSANSAGLGGFDDARGVVKSKIPAMVERWFKSGQRVISEQ
jgi:hypothetical protein